MTRKRYDKKDTPFGAWLRIQKDVSSAWYDAENLDYIWFQYRTGRLMLLEEKRHMGRQTTAQRDTHGIVDQALRFACEHGYSFKRVWKSRPKKITYYGYHIIKFEQTNPLDGKTFINGIEVSVEDLRRFLKFEWFPEGSDAHT